MLIRSGQRSAPETAPPGSVLDGDLVLLDLETTGTSATAHRIIEVGLIHLRGGLVMEEWSTLVNPQVPLSPFIQNYTGISQAMVAAAPTFPEVARELIARLQGRLLVAHNARFDYGFLKNEFARLGYTFQSPVLCTVKLSRRLYPRERRHGLDALIVRHGLSCSRRHRALDDARAVGDFLAQVRDSFPAETLQQAVQAQLRLPNLPSHLPPESLAEVPGSPGFYRFFDEEDRLLYVGKSVNLRSRILAHFSGDHRNSKGLRLSGQIHRLEWTPTAGELEALLLEARQIKERLPIHNRRLRRYRQLCSLTLRMDEAFLRPDIVPLQDVSTLDFASVYGLFKTPAAARKQLRILVEQHRLCAKILGLENGPGPCFGHQLHRCRGACVGQEPAALHNARLQTALLPERLKDWPFAGPVVLREHHPPSGREALLLIDRWCHLGTVTSQAALEELLQQPRQISFDPDGYRILTSYFARNRSRLEIFPLNRLLPGEVLSA